MGGVGVVMNMGTGGELTTGMNVVLRGRGVEVGGAMLMWGRGAALTLMPARFMGGI